MNKYCVYEHIRPDTGAVFYVGKGTLNRVRLLDRRHNKHHTNIRTKLQSIGLDIEVRVLWENLPNESSLALEKMRIVYLRSTGVSLVNLTDGGEGLFNPSQDTRNKLSEIASNRTISEETRMKLSAATSGENNPNYGKKHGPEARAKIRAANLGENNHNYGKSPSAETLEKRSAALTGKTRSKEQRAKLRAANLGKRHTEESKAKMSASRKGRIVSDDTREKLRGENNPFYGKKHSDKTRARIKECRTGSKASEETRAKMRASRQAYIARRNAEKVSTTSPPQCYLEIAQAPQSGVEKE